LVIDVTESPLMAAMVFASMGINTKKNVFKLGSANGKKKLRVPHYVVCLH
jgi:hypothetical protein